MTQTKMKPATPLPWEVRDDKEGLRLILEGNNGNEIAHDLPYENFFDSRNAAYIAHAANAYPRLVAHGEVEITAWQIAKDYDFNAQQFANDITPSGYHRRIDRDKLYMARELIRLRNERDALLREIGEAE